MINLKEIIGKKFGKLTIVGIVNEHTGSGKHIHIKCLCDCGKITFPRKSSVIYGKTKSCGCLLSETNKKRNTKHGLVGSRLYRIWNGIMERTEYKSKKERERYWDRGIKICDEWKNDFMSFYSWAIKNGYSDKLMIDRINNDGNYCPENCRWATRKEQARNTSKNKIIEYKGEKHCMSEWAEKFGINKNTLWKRIKKGYTFEKAIYCGKYKTRNKII